MMRVAPTMRVSPSSITAPATSTRRSRPLNGPRARPAYPPNFPDRRAEDVAGADRVVLPGVGAFADCRAGLDAVPGMVAAIREAVVDKARPFLGICVGMQLMAERGLEKTVTEGFGWIAGDVVDDRPRRSRPEGPADRLEYT